MLSLAGMRDYVFPRTEIEVFMDSHDRRERPFSPKRPEFSSVSEHHSCCAIAVQVQLVCATAVESQLVCHSGRVSGNKIGQKQCQNCLVSTSVTFISRWGLWCMGLGRKLMAPGRRDQRQKGMPPTDKRRTRFGTLHPAPCTLHPKP